MFTYHIKQNGYTIGQAKGKFKAVKHLKKILGERDEDRWFVHMDGTICVNIDNNSFTIEKGA